MWIKSVLVLYVKEQPRTAHTSKSSNIRQQGTPDKYCHLACVSQITLERNFQIIIW